MNPAGELASVITIFPQPFPQIRVVAQRRDIAIQQGADMVILPFSQRQKLIDALRSVELPVQP